MDGPSTPDAYHIWITIIIKHSLATYMAEIAKVESSFRVQVVIFSGQKWRGPLKMAEN
jgi:hypothetical protein